MKEISNALELSNEILNEIINETNMSVTCITQCIEDNDYLYFDCIVNTFDRKVSFAIYFKCSIANDDIVINEVSDQSFQ